MAYKLNINPELSAATDKVGGKLGPSKSREDEVKRESPNGYHYYSLYRDCPRKWYLKYILGLEPYTTGKALIFGGAIHSAKEAYYKNGFDIDIMLNTFHTELDNRAPEYEKPVDYETDKKSGPLMLDAWVSAYRDWDMKNLKILMVEDELQVPMGPEGKEVMFSVKPDLVAKRGDEVVIYDTKTSRWSLDKAIQNARLDDQLTSYVWAWNKTHPDGPFAKTAVIDAMYQKGKVTKAERSEDIIIPSFHQKQFEDGMWGTITEITQKVLGLQYYPWTYLFPRHGRICGIFGCPYEVICRKQIKPKENLPGYTHDPWVGEVEKWLETTQSWEEGDLSPLRLTKDQLLG